MENNRNQSTINFIQPVALLFIVLSGFALVYSFYINSQPTQKLISIIALTVLGVFSLLNNIFYFRAMDLPSLRKWENFISPSMVLIAFWAGVLFFQYGIKGFGEFSQPQLSVLLSTFTTFLSGYVLFYLPLRSRKNFLYDHDEQYDKLIIAVDQKMAELGVDLIVGAPEKKKLKDVTIYLEEIKKTLQLFVTISYSDYLGRKRRTVDFFQLGSLLAGPIISAIVNWFFQS